MNNDPSGKTRFSFVWCLAFAFLHLTATYIFVGFYMMAGMGISTREANDFHFAFEFWNGLLWILTPLAAAARSPDHTPNENLLATLAILWSCLVGIAAGFALPSFRRRDFSAKELPPEPVEGRRG